MGKELRKILVPSYLKKFKCIGAECEDSCCNGWKIYVDEATYKSYSKIKNRKLRAMLEKYITCTSEPPSPECYAKMELGQSGQCAFLSEGKLCRLQSELGIGYLPKVCMTYPTHTYKLNDNLERSATTSCPEAARLILLEPSIMEFEYLEEDVNARNLVISSIYTEGEQNANKPERYFWSLRDFTIDLLQNRNYSLGERLIILGIFLKKVQGYVDSADVRQIPGALESYRNMVSNVKDMKQDIKGIPVQNSLQVKLMKEMSDQRFSIKMTHERYIQCHNEMLKGIGCVENAALEDLTIKYAEAYNKYYLPYMEVKEYILENYLVNTVFKEMFPFGQHMSVFENYTLLISRYAMIKLNLVGMAAFHEGLNDELVIKAIQSISHQVDHNPGYMAYLIELLKENGINTLPYMAILIMN